MKRMYFIIIVLALSGNVKLHSQTAYNFQYRSSGAGDTTKYNAFFVYYNTGAGFMRIRFKAPGSNELIVAEIKIHSEEIADKLGNVDTSQLYYADINAPEYKFGNSKNTIPVPMFWFKMNAASNVIEPSGVFFKDIRGNMQPGMLLQQDLVMNESLDKNFLSEYFSPGEDFYESVIHPSTGSRGIFSELAKKIKLILVIVANTNDPTVGKAAVLDMKRVLYTFDTICRYTGITLDTSGKIIYGKNYNKSNVIKVINGLQPDINDIVVFYYSGHGFRKDKDERVYPYIDLRPKDDKTYMVNSLNIEDIYQAIIHKPNAARLNLVLSDCCNTLPGVPIPNGKAIISARGMDKWNPKRVVELFLDPKPKNILFTAANVGQTAGCDSTSGSFFTIFFKVALENNLVSRVQKPISWEKIFAETKDETEWKVSRICCDRPPPCFTRDGCKQNPIKMIQDLRATGTVKRLQ